MFLPNMVMLHSDVAVYQSVNPNDVSGTDELGHDCPTLPWPTNNQEWNGCLVRHWTAQPGPSLVMIRFVDGIPDMLGNISSHLQ